MGLNRINGNMYEFVTHTWNMIKGKCFHNCSYCYMKALNPRQKRVYLDDREFETNLGKNNFIFVGSGIDLFADNISSDWIDECLDKCYEANNTLFGDENQYFFQSKNPQRILEFEDHPVFKSSVICTTIETNRWYAEHMGNCPKIEDRVSAMEEISRRGLKTYVTVEPLMDFDLAEMIDCIRRCNPTQVNFGKESKGLIKLPSPDKQKVQKLITAVAKFTEHIVLKKNLLNNSEKDLVLYYDLEKEKLMRKK